MKILSSIALCAFAITAQAQQTPIQNDDVYELTHKLKRAAVRNEIRIPMVDGLLPLKCDFHIHTIYSDGSVMPHIRVSEAWQHGLDAIAITDHIEYRPNKNILKGDLNESNKQAVNAAKGTGLIVIKGTEITRAKPLGHLNALFIKDANVMDIEDPLKAIDLAVAQGAFVLWNHPGWPDNKSTLYPVHEKLMAEKKIHGVETFNEYEYYPISFDWCNDYDLAYIGNSDIHGLISTEYGMDNRQRPLTIVFAKTKSEASIKEAMFARRTVALFDGQLAGKADILKKLVVASLRVTDVGGDNLEIYNDSDISYRVSGNGAMYQLPAGKTVRLKQPTEGNYTVDNCHTGANKVLTMTAEELF